MVVGDQLLAINEQDIFSQNSGLEAIRTALNDRGISRPIFYVSLSTAIQCSLLIHVYIYQTLWLFSEGAFLRTSGRLAGKCQRIRASSFVPVPCYIFTYL